MHKNGSSLHLDADGEQEARLREDGEGLVVGNIFPIIPHCVVQDSIRNEEEHHGAVAAVQGALEEGFLVKVQVELAGGVELWMLETPHVVDILASRGRQRRSCESGAQMWLFGVQMIRTGTIFHCCVQTVNMSGKSDFLILFKYETKFKKINTISFPLLILPNQKCF